MQICLELDKEHILLDSSDRCPRCAELDNERILVRGQNRTLEAWASEAKHVEAQNALQKKIFQERCVELQAKLDQQRVAYYDKNRELEVMRIHHEEEKHQLQKQIEDASRDHDSWVKEKRTNRKIGILVFFFSLKNDGTCP